MYVYKYMYIYMYTRTHTSTTSNPSQFKPSGSLPIHVLIVCPEFSTLPSHNRFWFARAELKTPLTWAVRYLYMYWLIVLNSQHPHRTIVCGLARAELKTPNLPNPRRAPGRRPALNRNTERNLKLPCAPKWFDFKFPLIKTTKLLVKTHSCKWAKQIYQERFISSCRAPLRPWSAG